MGWTLFTRLHAATATSHHGQTEMAGFVAWWLAERVEHEVTLFDPAVHLSWPSTLFASFRL
jgi:hypothetical protein